jgi:hypothetical protein
MKSAVWGCITCRINQEFITDALTLVCEPYTIHRKRPDSLNLTDQYLKVKLLVHSLWGISSCRNYAVWTHNVKAMSVRPQVSPRKLPTKHISIQFGVDTTHGITSIFWDIMPCSPLEVNRRFGGTCHVHFQGRRISHARNHHEKGSKKRFRLLISGYRQAKGWTDTHKSYI